jgi:hypothetical protein
MAGERGSGDKRAFGAGSKGGGLAACHRTGWVWGKDDVEPLVHVVLPLDQGHQGQLGQLALLWRCRRGTLGEPTATAPAPTPTPSLQPLTPPPRPSPLP